MHIETLKLFIDLSTSGSFSQAGKDNNISQSAVSQQIMCLEKRLGLTLLVRGGRSGVELTGEGKIFRSGCEAILERYNDVLEALVKFQNNIEGNIRLVAESSLGAVCLRKQVETFLLHYPDTNIDVEYADCEGVYLRVIAGEADLGVVPHPIRRPGLQIDLLQAENLMLLACACNQMKQREEWTLSDMEGERFVAFASNAEMRAEIQRQFAMQGLDFLPDLEFDQVDAAKQAVLEGGGITLLPAVAAAEDVSAGVLVHIPLKCPFTPLPMGVVSRRDRLRSPVFRAFLEWLQLPRN